MRSRGSSSVVPDPWQVLARDLPDVALIRERIREPGRYYHEHRVIVLRKGLKIEEERRYLWHELTHALREDESCQGWAHHVMERSVEREAAQRAMPLSAMEASLSRAATWTDFVWDMKVPEPWVRFRVEIAHPAERALMREACRWAESA